jgi:F-type H+-transporting ATPase subunit a
MAEGAVVQHELPDVLALLAERFKGNPFFENLYLWEHVVYSLFIMAVISAIAFYGTRKNSMIPGRLQNAVEVLAGGLDDFVCGILGPQGRRYTPFIGTLFIYILFMNLSGLVPFLKPSTSSWSTTLALALCVFFYVQYSALKELGVRGYLDHLAGRPRGAIAFSVVIPLLMFFLHLVGELIKPLSLSLRLRSNIWGDDVLLSVLTSFGMQGFPLLFFNMFSSLLAAVVQAVVFCLLSTIYFAVVLTHEE